MRRLVAGVRTTRGIYPSAGGAAKRHARGWAPRVHPLKILLLSRLRDGNIVPTTAVSSPASRAIMRLCVAVLAFAVLPACSLNVRSDPPPTNRADYVASSYVGSWKGTGSQSDNPGVEWTIALTLMDGKPGEVVGTITYPSLTCGGDLILLGGNGRGVELRERITFGECVDRGVVSLGDSKEGEISFSWRDDAGLEAHGSLHRAQPPSP
jgi:hypothetical protein